uniref:Transmembrane protein n=1 Tax=Echinococcus granulosus TaxID=6210 RepID=U6FQT0_ECHGR|nr:hypothetical protein EgrG_002069200 [Echinococcus granulosus]
MCLLSMSSSSRSCTSSATSSALNFNSTLPVICDCLITTSQCLVGVALTLAVNTMAKKKEGKKVHCLHFLPVDNPWSHVTGMNVGGRVLIHCSGVFINKAVYVTLPKAVIVFFVNLAIIVQSVFVIPTYIDFAAFYRLIYIPTHKCVPFSIFIIIVALLPSPISEDVCRFTVLHCAFASSSSCLLRLSRNRGMPYWWRMQTYFTVPPSQARFTHHL